MVYNMTTRLKASNLIPNLSVVSNLNSTGKTRERDAGEERQSGYFSLITVKFGIRLSQRLLNGLSSDTNPQTLTILS